MTWNNTQYTWDATASFSWYLYQADVALLFALKKILALKEAWNDNEIEKCTLEVEWEEDFSLINNDTNFKELYQVKETYWTEAKYYTEPVIKLFESFKLWWDKKEFLVTTNDLWKVNNIDFFDWLYAWNNLTKTQTILKYLYENDTFLKEKIDFLEGRTRPYWAEREVPFDYKFKDTETKDTINEYVLQNVSNFIKDENFSYHCWGTFLDIQWNIKELISSIRIKYWNTDNINTEHYLRFLESYIKRFIQRRKIEWLTETISLKEVILDNVLKNWEDIFNELVKNDFYQDVFLNYFIDKFNLKLEEIKNRSIFQYIKDDLWEENYLKFIDFLKESISNNVFSSKDKFYLFIRYISPKQMISYFDSDDKISTFTELLNDISLFTSDESIKNKIILLTKLFYLKKKWLVINKDKYFWEKTDIDLDFSINNKKAILTWNQQLNDDEIEDDIVDILNSNIEYLFQKDFIWIKNSWWSILEILWWMGNIKEPSFISSDENIQIWILNDKYNIALPKDIRIFCCWCSVDNKDKMLSDECWRKSNCDFKN